jgi:hypothetical protein
MSTNHLHQSAHERAAIVFAAIASASQPLTVDDITCRAKPRMTRKEVVAALRILLDEDRISHRGRGQNGGVYQAMVVTA